MENELMPLETVKELSSALTTLLVNYRKNSIISKGNRECVQIKIKACLARERSVAIGAITRTNIMEIDKTIRLIDSLQLNGYAYQMAMRQLEELEIQLRQILNNY